MRDSITVKRKRGRITEINLTGKAAGNFFKALMQAQGGKDNGKASKTESLSSIFFLFNRTLARAALLKLRAPLRFCRSPVSGRAAAPVFLLCVQPVFSAMWNISLYSQLESILPVFGSF